MKRIFLTLACVSTVLFAVALALGFAIGDPHSVAPATRRMLSYHVLGSVAALIFACLVHAVLLTYFMGTSRWMEETGLAYGLDVRWKAENQRLKYRAIPVMVVCVLLLLTNIPLGAMSVDGGQRAWSVPGFGMLSPTRIHLIVAVATFLINIAVNVVEYRAISRNSRLIAAVVGEVRKIRVARGLPV